MNLDVNTLNGNSEATPKPRASRWRAVLQNLALATGTFLLCACILEVIFRIAGYGNLEIYQPDEVLYWRLKPSQQCFTKVGRKPVRINSLGTRGAEFTAEKPPGVFRILSLGDSRTFGWGVAEAHTYSILLQTAVQSTLGPTSSVEVINAGVNAWSYPQLLAFYRATAREWHPNLVIIGEANLWTQFSDKNSPEFVKSFMARVRLKNFLRRFATYHYVVEVKLKDFYEKHRTRFIPVDPKRDALFKEQQQKDPEQAFRQSIDALCAAILKDGARPVLLFLPTQDQLSSSNAPAIRAIKADVAARRGIRLVDITPASRSRANELYLDGDPVHFNEAGHQLIARELAEAIRLQAGL